MKLVTLRVTSAQVTINHQTVGSIGPGFLVYVGFGVGDTKATVDHLAYKLLHLRVMADDNDRFNRSILDTQGAILVVSQFTLYAKLNGHRPSFTTALVPDQAQILYGYFIQKLKESKLHVQSGIFGAKMDVSSTNSGPVTILMESTHE